MKKVMMFSYMERHFKKLIPLILKARENHDFDLTTVLMSQAEKECAEAQQIPYISLDSYSLKQKNHDFDLGWGLEALISAIDTVKPDIFIALEVNYILRNAIRYCKQQGIPTVIIQHGTPNKYSLHAFAPFEGDLFLAWGDFTKDFLVANHVSKDKIVVTGGINFDRTVTLSPDKNAIAAFLGIDPLKTWILFTAQGSGAGGCPSEDEIKVGIAETVKAAGEYENLVLIIQPHPAQTVETIQTIVSETATSNTVISHYRDTEALIAASDGLITFFSTTAIDAIVLKKPLMLINLSEDRFFLPFVKMNAAIGAYTKDEISNGFAQLISAEIISENIEKAKQYVNFMNEEPAIERIVRIICEKLI